MIPLMVDCSHKKVTIFGGGEVGARKARYFSDEADVTVYSRSFTSAFETISCRQITADISTSECLISDLIKGAFLVIAATSDPQLNATIHDECRNEGILCNNATKPAGDVILPAKYSGNRFTIAVSTLGGSPAVARFIREHIETTWPDLDQMIDIEEDLRSRLKETGISELERREILTAVLRDPEVWSALRTGTDQAHQLIEGKYMP